MVRRPRYWIKQETNTVLIFFFLFAPNTIFSNAPESFCRPILESVSLIRTELCFIEINYREFKPEVQDTQPISKSPLPISK